MLYAVFYHKDKELAAYTLRGTFPGELTDTRSLLAHEHKLPLHHIDVKIEDRPYHIHHKEEKQDDTVSA